MSDVVETMSLQIGVEGRLGVITLNRPEAINALTHNMVLRVAAQLEAWRNDGAIRAVLFEGKGPRGFCSGGDVRAVRSLMLEGRRDEAIAFFADEYKMNGIIAGYDKPVIALADGIVMGGGIGIAGHADFRFAATTARFAMPEAAIGFVSDVGVNAILARAPLHRALLFLLSGLPAGAADALALGLTDCVIAPERMAEVRQGLITAAEAGEVDTAIVSLMSGVTMEPGEATLSADADLLMDDLGHASAEEIVAEIAESAVEDPRFAKLSETLATHCPTSLEAIFQSHRAARRLQDMAPVLALDLRLAAFMSARPDFIEGVRAVLVDKDGRARWNADFPGVPRAEIAAVVAGPGAPLSTS